MVKVKINNHRYHTIKPPKRKILKIRQTLSSFTHEELFNIFKQNVFKKIHTN